MSSNKYQKALRRYRDYLAIARQLSICYYSPSEPVVKQPGRFRKHHANNCGRSMCMMCSNPRKTWKRKTLAEIRVLQQLKYEVDHYETE